MKDVNVSKLLSRLGVFLAIYMGLSLLGYPQEASIFSLLMMGYLSLRAILSKKIINEKHKKSLRLIISGVAVVMILTVDMNWYLLQEFLPLFIISSIFITTSHNQYNKTENVEA